MGTQRLDLRKWLDLRKGLDLQNGMTQGGTVETYTGVPPFEIVGKKKLLSVKAFGGCSQNGTPTPDNPVDIACNNGVLKWDSVNERVYIDGRAEKITITPGGSTATAEMLLKVGDYQDVQEILHGDVTRNIGVKVFNGKESFSSSMLTNCWTLSVPWLGQGTFTDRTIYCTHYNHSATLLPLSDRQGFVFLGIYNNYYTVAFGATERFTNQTQFKQWLADQYAAGTPVIIVYPLVTPVTEQVTGQTLALTSGTNIIDITQASLQGLELEVKAK